MNNFIVSDYVILLSGSPSAWVAHLFQLKAPKHISGLFASTFVLCILKQNNSIHPFLPQATFHSFECDNSNMFKKNLRHVTLSPLEVSFTLWDCRSICIVNYRK